MPLTVSHALSMTTPDDPAYENKPSNWNSVHAFTASMTGSEISGAFSNANNVSFGLNGGGAVTGSAVVNVSAGGTSNNMSAMTFGNGGGVTFGITNSVITASHNGLTSQSNQAFSADGGSSAFQTLSFSNNNGVSFSNSNGQVVGSVATSYRASNDAVGLNTAQSNVTWTAGSNGLSLDARGYAGTGMTFGGTNVSGSFTLNSGGLQMSMSVAAPGGGGGYTASSLANVLPIGMQTRSVDTNIYVTPLHVGGNVSFSFLRIPRIQSWSSTSGGTTANTTVSWGVSSTYSLCLYSRGTGGSSNSYMTLSSSSYSLAMSGNVGAAAVGSQYTASYGFTFPCATGTSASMSFSTNYSNASIQMSTTQFTVLTRGLQNGTMQIEMPFAGSLSAGDYLLGVALRTSASTQVTNFSYATNCRYSTNALGCVTIAGNAVYAFGDAMTTIQSRGALAYAWVGPLGASTIGDFNISAISQAGNNNFIAYQLRNYY